MSSILKFIDAVDDTGTAMLLFTNTTHHFSRNTSTNKGITSEVIGINFAITVVSATLDMLVNNQEVLAIMANYSQIGY